MKTRYLNCFFVIKSAQILLELEEKFVSLQKSIQTLLIGFILWVCLCVGVGQNPMMAANFDAETGSIAQEKIQPLPEEVFTLELGVDHFLTSIAAGYYTIANSEGLKRLLKNL